MSVAVPPTHTDLLEKPTFAHLATVRPDGGPQSSVMWFEWDRERIRFAIAEGDCARRDGHHRLPTGALRRVDDSPRA
jgi:Pyridoxamine 5'-phosphate oxidase